MEKIHKIKALKVKSKHLAEEARIIRFEEKRSNGSTRDWLHEHRVHVVRPEARATQIAYAFARGIPLESIERYPESIPSSVWDRVGKMIRAYANKSVEEYNKWLDSSMVEQASLKR